MNLYFRLILIFLRSFFVGKLDNVLDEGRLIFHVLPNDLDMNGHMNNGRYPTIMDLGRLDFILRTGLLFPMLRQKTIPVLATVSMRFRIPLFLWQRYELHTRVLCWDDKWVYMEQRFIILKGSKKGAVAAIGLVKGGFYDPKARETVPTQELLHVIGYDDPSPAFPDHIQEWIRAEGSLRAVTPGKEPS